MQLNLNLFWLHAPFASEWMDYSAVCWDHIWVIKLIYWLLCKHLSSCNCCHIVCSKSHHPSLLPSAHASAQYIIFSVPVHILWQKFLTVLNPRQSLANCQYKIILQVSLVQYKLNFGFNKTTLPPHLLDCTLQFCICWKQFLLKGLLIT
jgi:hypothetical protein